MSAGQPKENVRAYWDQAPCGTPDVADLEELTRYRELERIRYEREPFLARVARFADARGLDMLEVGVGAGTDHLNFARAGAHCHGIDLTEAGIAMTRRRLQLEGLSSQLQRADAEHLPFDTARFDFVYSWGVIHHTPDTTAAAREILRVLKPGGRFTVMVYNRRSLLAAQAWLVFGLARGRPFAGAKDLIANHVESPGTNAYTAVEALDLFADARTRQVETIVTAHDLRVGRRRYLPHWTASLVPAGFGWFHVVTGTR
ncbi:MAG: methyltransferase domain-containing protein [Myxococcales bacterium]|nr:methyltransferase domain-containing protein [Myxococcales bacterium]